MESVFAIIAEPNRRAILRLLASSERSVGEIERSCDCRSPRSPSTCGCCARPASWSRASMRSGASTGSGPSRSWRSTPGSLPSAASGRPTSTRSNATSIGWIKHHVERKETMSSREDVCAGPRRGRRGPEGRREVDARSRPRAPPPAGEGLAGADRPRAPARMGAVRRRPEPRRRRPGEALDGRDADAAGLRDAA